MATVPEKEAPAPTRAERVKAVAAKPDTRVAVALAVAGAAGSLAPDPFGALAAACVVLVAWEARRR